MFIPVTFGTGTTSVDCEVNASGTLNAACTVVYNGRTYDPNTDILVPKGATVTLRTDITANAEILVKLVGRSYFWRVRLPLDLRYGTDRLYEKVTGATLGKLYRVTSGTSQTYVETGTVALGADLTASIDHANKAVWFFGAAGVKKVVTPDKPVAVVFTPRWSLADNVSTSVYVVTASKIHKLSDTLTLDAGAALPNNLGTIASAAALNSGGMLIVGSGGFRRFDGTNFTAPMFNPGGTVDGITGPVALAVGYDDVVYIGQPNGNITSYSYANDVMTRKAGLYAPLDPASGNPLTITAGYLFDINTADYLFAIDYVNRRLLSFNTAKGTSASVFLDKVPSNVVSDNNGSVYVTFFDTATAIKFSNDLATQSNVTTPAVSVGAAYTTELLTTDLYADAAKVTTVENTAAQRINVYDLAVNQSNVYTFKITNERPIAYSVLGMGAVTVNGKAFTGGYLWKGDVVTVTVLAESGYYAETQVDLVGAAPISLLFRTVPKTWPDKVKLDDQLDAFVNLEYTRQFTVAGITEGFTSDLVTDATTQLTFAVNDGAFGKSATVKNGDVVTVKSKVKSLVQQRTDYTIDTKDKLNTAASWTILVMALNGVTVRHDATQSGSRSDLLRMPPQETADVATRYIQKPAAISVSQATTGAVQRNALSVDSKYKSGVCPQRGTFDGSWDSIKVQRSTQQAFDKPSSAFAAKARQLSTAYADVGVQKQSPTATWAGAWQTITRNDVSVAYAIKEFTVAVALHPYDVAAVYLRTPSARPVDTNGVYGRYVPTHLEFGARDVLVTAQRAGVDTKMPVQRAQANVPLFTSQAYSRYIALRNNALDANYGYRQQVQSWNGNLTGQRAGNWLSHEVDARYALRELNVPQFYANAGAVQTHATSVETAYNAAQVQHGHSESRIAVFAVQRPNAAVAVTRPVGVVVVRAENFTTGNETGFLANEQDAINDAASVGATRAEYFQVNGKWLYVNAPESENAMCTITPKPPAQQRRFGYLGGG